VGAGRRLRRRRRPRGPADASSVGVLGLIREGPHASGSRAPFSGWSWSSPTSRRRARILSAAGRGQRAVPPRGGALHPGAGSRTSLLSMPRSTIRTAAAGCSKRSRPGSPAGTRAPGGVGKRGPLRGHHPTLPVGHNQQGHNQARFRVAAQGEAVAAGLSDLGPRFGPAIGLKSPLLNGNPRCARDSEVAGRDSNPRPLGYEPDSGGSSADPALSQATLSVSRDQAASSRSEIPA
jgi:hypothetical protein